MHDEILRACARVCEADYPFSASAIVQVTGPWGNELGVYSPCGRILLARRIVKRQVGNRGFIVLRWRKLVKCTNANQLRVVASAVYRALLLR